MTGLAARTREIAALTAQYGLLGGFASVAAGISAQGLIGFARANMGLRGPWPYLLFFALDGAAGVCAVLLMRRAARADSGLAPRLAVWGLVTASATFNWTHAPRHPAAPEAFALMPVVAAVLFEFSLRELQLRTASRAGRRLAPLRWLHPAEYVRVRLMLAADDGMSAATATRRIRVRQAARRLYILRRILGAAEQASRPGALAARRASLAERRAHSALTRAAFTDPAVASEVLRQVQVLALTRQLARLDYGSAEAVRATVASLATPRLAAAGPGDGANCSSVQSGQPPVAEPGNGRGPGADRYEPAQPRLVPGAREASPTGSWRPSGRPAAGKDGTQNSQLIRAAADIIGEAIQHGRRVSQTALAEQLRTQGYGIANERLHWLLATASDIAEAQQPAATPPQGNISPESSIRPEEPAASSTLPVSGARSGVPFAAEPERDRSLCQAGNSSAVVP